MHNSDLQLWWEIRAIKSRHIPILHDYFDLTDVGNDHFQ